MDDRFRELEEAITDLKLEIQRLIHTLISEQEKHKNLIEMLVKTVDGHNTILRGDNSVAGILIKVDRLEQEAERRDKREMWFLGIIASLVVEAAINWLTRLHPGG